MGQASYRRTSGAALVDVTALSVLWPTLLGEALRIWNLVN
jgi:hypothetical protein